MGSRRGELHGGDHVLTTAVPADIGVGPPPIGVDDRVHRAAHQQVGELGVVAGQAYHLDAVDGCAGRIRRADHDLEVGSGRHAFGELSAEWLVDAGDQHALGAH